MADSTTLSVAVTADVSDLTTQLAAAQDAVRDYASQLEHLGEEMAKAGGSAASDLVEKQQALAQAATQAREEVQRLNSALTSTPASQPGGGKQGDKGQGASSLDEQSVAVTRYNTVAAQRLALQTDIDRISQKAAADTAAGATQEAAADRQALAVAQEKLRTLHDPAEAAAHARRMAALQQETAAAGEDAARRGALQRQMYEEIVRYEGQGTAAAIQARTQLTAAEQQQTQQQLRQKIDALRQEQTLHADNSAFVLAKENEIVTAMAAAGRQGTEDYRAELNRRAQVQNQAETRQLAATLDARKQALMAELQTTADKQAVLSNFEAWYTQTLAGHDALLKQAADFQIQQTRRAEEESRRASDKRIEDAIRADQRALANKIRSLESAATAHTATQQQMTAGTVAASQEEYEAERALLTQKQEIDKANLQARQRDDDALLALDARYYNALLVQAEKAAQGQQKTWTQSLEPINRAVDQSVTGIIQGNQTASQALSRAATSMVTSYAQSGVKMATDWLKNQILMTQETDVQSKARALIEAISNGEGEQKVKAATQAFLASQQAQTAAAKVGSEQRAGAGATENAGFFSRIGTQLSSWLGLETAKTGATTTGAATRATTEESAALTTKAVNTETAVASIGSKAADAAAGAYNAMADIPIVGPVLGAAAAVATFMAVMAYASIASAEGGWGEVPYDGAPAILHKKEMVLPASIAVPLRQMIGQQTPALGLPQNTRGGGMSAPAAAAATPGGTVHNHNYSINVSALDSKSFQSFLKTGGGDVIVQHLQNKRRNFGA